MGEFQEKFKVIVDTFSTGSTTEKISKYYDMQKSKRVDFFFSGLVKLPSSGALGGTDFQNFTLRVLQATDSTGGGASALSSATAVVGKNSATGISADVKCREGFINFSTLTSAVPIAITVGTAVYSVSTVAAGVHVAESASQAAATAACQAFVTMFNSTVNNTATGITANWLAATEAAGVPFVRIVPKDPDGTHLLALSATGSSQAGVGGVFTAHIAVDRQFMGDGKRYIAIGVKSTEHANPYTITVIREMDNQPAVPVTYSKSLNASTSK
jgi:hypothetical protein